MEYIMKSKLVLSNERIVTYKLRSWRLIVLDTNCNDVKVTIDDETDDIVSLSFDGLYQISRGTVIPMNYKDRIYNFSINHIIIEENIIYLAETERNITTRFILPLLRINSEDIGSEYLLNAYMYYNDDCSGEYIYLLYKYIDEDNYKILESKLKKQPSFINQSDPTNKLTLFKFKLQETYKESVQLIINGKYSKISNEAKRIILRYHKVGQKSDLGCILYRDPTAVKLLEEEFKVQLDDDLDIFRKMYKEDETFRIDRILTE